MRRESKYELQASALQDLLRSSADRIYWCSLIDLDARRDAIEGFHLDENEDDMGIVKFDGFQKPACKLLKSLTQ